jgi:hypothetical protein
MQVDIDHVLFWMDAIRDSEDRYRTLESFWKGQIKSKIWLIENLIPFIKNKNNKIVIHGGWNGVLASLLFQTNIDIEKIISIDIDQSCENIARKINQIEEISNKFQSITHDMATYKYEFIPDIIINTSCEHITQETYDLWLKQIPDNSLIVLQSNNYNIDEHIRCASSIKEFEEQSNIIKLHSGILNLPKYDRFMLIGKKNDKI